MTVVQSCPTGLSMKWKGYFLSKRKGISNMKNLLSMKDLTIDEITTILNRAEILKQHGIRELPEKYMISNLFFEPSTRTKMSFEVAERKLGLETIPFEAGSSSAVKGESLYDTLRT